MAIQIQNKVSQTLLIPLYMRALEAQRRNLNLSCVLYDHLAEEIISKIPYDYAKFEQGSLSKFGCVVRAQYFDAKVEDFIANNENAVVILGGCGLDTRYHRLSLKEIPHFSSATFYEVDLPEVIEIRKELIGESQRDICLAESLLEKNWLEALVKKHPKSPFIVVIEGVIMYFSNPEVLDLLHHLTGLISKGEIWFDVCGSMFKRVKHELINEKVIDTTFKSAFNSPKDILKYELPLELIEFQLYASLHKSRWGFAGVLMRSLPMLSRRFSSLMGFRILDGT